MDTEINTHQIGSVLLAKAEALVRRDVRALAALIHPDFIYVNASGQTFDKYSYVDTCCASGRVVFLDQKMSEFQVRQFGNFAIATLVLKDKFVASEQIVEGCYHSLCVFSAVGQEWQWAAGQTMTQQQS